MTSILGRILIDHKTTEASSFRIVLDKWKTFKRIAAQRGMLAGYQVDLPGESFITFSLTTYDEIVNYIIWLEEKVKEGRERGTRDREI